MTAATAPAIAPRTEVAADDTVDDPFVRVRLLVGRFFADREAARRGALRVGVLALAFAVLGLAGVRFALERFVTVRRVDFFALLRAGVRLAVDRLDMM
jgi:hypothetical protein